MDLGSRYEKIMVKTLGHMATLVLVTVALSVASGQDEAIILKHADHGESHWRQGKLITSLVGNVHFVSGSLTLRSDRAFWHQDAEMVVFEGRVSLEDTAQILRANRLTYLQEERKALADGEVSLVDSSNNLVLTAGHVEYERDSRVARATFQPQLIIQREERAEPVVIRGRHMELLSREKRAVVTDQVVISRGSLEARCGRAIYLDLEDRIFLEESPRAQEDESSLTGERMILHLQDNRIRRIEVAGKASGEYVQEADSTGQYSSRHRVTAQNITFHLDDQQVERITAEKNVTSTYLPSGQEQPRRGESITSGDRLEISLDRGKVERAMMQGGALGYYAPPENGAEGADTLKYRAQLIDYHLDRNEIGLREEAFLEYGQISLGAYQIDYNPETEVLTAQERPPSEGQGVMEVGRPTLREGDKELVGSQMVYNLRTQRGKVVGGETDFEKGHYRGDSIRKVDEDVLKADRGTYTTCDRETAPHYHFYSRRMKIILRDKIIAQPVILYIHRIPVMMLPFYVFPIKRGRHSGFLIPRYGSTDVEGRYLKNAGYYLAPSQYWDAAVSMDFYERAGWLLRLDGQYAVRYLLRGSLSGSYKWDQRYVGSLLQKRKRWELRLDHSQDLSPSWKLLAKGAFVGENDRSYYRDISDDPLERMSKDLHSYVSLDKSWSSTRAHLAFDQRWDLDQDLTTRYLPTISFQRFEAPILGKKAPGQPAERESQPWYNSVYYRYSAHFINSLKDWSELQDGQMLKRREEHQALDQTLGLRVPLTLLGHLALTPSATYRETWFDRDKAGRKFVRRGDYDANLGATTTLYGLVSPKLGPLVGIRHVLKPSLSFSWRPDFKDRDDYYSLPFIHSVGGPQKTLGISLANQFQVKIKRGEKEHKYNLADLNFNTSYNFRAATRKLSDLTSSLRVHPSRYLSITVAARHDFYEPDAKTLRLLNPRLLSFSVDSRLTLTGFGFGSLESSTPGGKGWRLNLSHRYSESRTTSGTRTSSWLSGGISFNLTSRWRVDYSGRYDLEEEKIVSQRIEFYRDLHCWEARIVWEPTGIREGYYLRVNIKAIPEIKLERAKGLRTY